MFSYVPRRGFAIGAGRSVRLAPTGGLRGQGAAENAFDLAGDTPAGGLPLLPVERTLGCPVRTTAPERLTFLDNVASAADAARAIYYSQGFSQRD